MTADQAVLWRKHLIINKKKLALTNGCFDIMHRGHAEYLADARDCADALVVLLNSDASIRRLKGPTRPICAENDRAFMLASLACVDAVVIFDSDRCTGEIAAIRPDCYIKGGDYTLDKLDASEREALLSCGAKIIFKPFIPGFSTTTLIERIRN